MNRPANAVHCFKSWRAWLGILLAAMGSASLPAEEPTELRDVLICTVELADALPCATAAQVEATLFTNSKNIDGAMRAASYGQMGMRLGNGSGMDPTVELVFPETAAYWADRGSTALKNAMAAELSALGYGTGTSSYDHILYLQPSSVGGSAPAWGTYNGNVTVYKSFSFYAAMHEMGHNLGLNHSASDFNDDGSWEGAYNDETCAMGGGNDTFNACKKVWLGWLDAWPGSVTTLSSSGSHTLVPLNHDPDTVPGERVVIIPDLAGGAIYVSYRLTGPAPYNTLASTTSGRVSLHRLPNPDGISRILGYYDEGEVFVNEGNGVRITVDSIADDLMSAEVTIDVGYEWIQGGDPTRWDDPANWAGGVLPPADDPNAVVIFGPAATGSIAGASATGDEKVTLSSLRWESSFQWDAFGEEGQPTTTGVFVDTTSGDPATAFAANGATLTASRVPWSLDTDLKLTGDGKLAIQASGPDGVNGSGGFIVEAGTELLFEGTVPESTYNYAYTGGVTIRDGGLVDVNSDNGALGSGRVTIAEGGRLELADGTAASDVEFVIRSDGSSTPFLGGSGVVTFNGAFTFDLLAANSAAGSTWQIVDPAMTATYGASFSITGFTESGGVWTGTVMGDDYSFNESTGVLTCVTTNRMVYTWVQGGNPTMWDDAANWADGVVPPSTDTNTVIDFGSNASGDIAGESAAGNEKVTVRSLRWSTTVKWTSFGQYGSQTTTGVFIDTGSADPAFAVASGNKTLNSYYVPWNLDSDLVLTGSGKLAIQAFGTSGVNGPGGFIVDPGTVLEFNNTHGSEDYTYTGGVTIRDGGLVNINSSNGALGDGLVTIDQGGELMLKDGGMDNDTRFVLNHRGSSAAAITRGSVTFTGTFSFDLAAAGTDAGTTWQIVDPGMSATYGTGFSVAGFTEASGVWVGFANGAQYRYDQSTGMLSCEGAVSLDPVFIADPLVGADANADAAYTGQTLAGSALDPDGDTLTYSKTAGPAWLSVAADGTLSGTPGFNDFGQNSFTVQVEDGNGGSDTATLLIHVGGSIAVVNTGSLHDNTDRTSYTMSFTAGAADKLIVSACYEGGPANSSLVITYNGDPLTLVPGTAGTRNEGIWFIDNPYTGGVADLVISGGGTTFGAMGMGIVAISGSAPGYDVGSISPTDSVTLDVSADGSFVFANCAANNGTIPTPAAPLTQLYRGELNSSEGAAGYAEDVAAGSQTFSFTGTPTSPEVSAAVFKPVSRAYEAWLGAHFTETELNDVNVSGPGADPDGDRFGNLTEYGLGLDPNVFDGMDAIASYEDLSGTMGWIFALRKHSERSDVDVYLERSLTLRPDSWQTIARVRNGGALEVLNGASLIEQSGSDPELLRIQEPLDGEPNAFYRWFIERPNP